MGLRMCKKGACWSGCVIQHQLIGVQTWVIILPPFVDLYIIHYVLIAYSTLNIVSFVYIYTFINLFVFSLLNLFIYLSIFLRAVG